MSAALMLRFAVILLAPLAVTATNETGATTIPAANTTTNTTLTTSVMAQTTSTGAPTANTTTNTTTGAPIASTTSTGANAMNVTTSKAEVPGRKINNTFLNPGGSATCSSKCRYYFAGASASDAVVCQKQASGVGFAEQNMLLGVNCYPAYGCGRDMTACVNQDWTAPLPKGNASFACEDLANLTAENPWSCGSAEEDRTACQHSTPNNNVGKWLKATADLGCGWGSTYGNVRPGYTGPSLPATSFFTGITSDYECCLKAMEFEDSTWDQGGAALFFAQGLNQYEQAGDHCRVDREKIIYGNMDSSSGRSVKYQTTRCGSNAFYYRHGAGAADAANLHTGGKCVLQGGFKRAPLSSGTNLPKGELPYGVELPNEDCEANDTLTPQTGCSAMIMFNTINDAEECCTMCKDLSWFAPNTPNKGGDASRDTATGLHVNPCVAWQIVNGRCRITRKAYFNYHGPSQTILEAITDSDYKSPGDTGWVISTRGCGTKRELCNYFSSIYYREVGTPDNVNASDPVFRKIMKEDIIPNQKTIEFQFTASSVPSRRDTRQDLVTTDGVTTRQNSANVGTSMGGSDCGRLEIYAETALVKSGDYDMFDEEKELQPLCVSDCISSGTTSLSCNISNISGSTDQKQDENKDENKDEKQDEKQDEKPDEKQDGGRGTGRRLASSSTGVVLSFTGVGSGYDEVNFEASASEPPVAPTAEGEISVAPTTKGESEPTATAASTTNGTGSAANITTGLTEVSASSTTTMMTEVSPNSTTNGTGSAASTGMTEESATSTTTGMTEGSATSTTIALAPIEIRGGVTMTVPDPVEFLTDMVAQGAVKDGIAAAHSTGGHTVKPSDVTLEVTILRRLAAGMRRLAGSVKVAYTIAVPADSTVQENMKQLAVAVTVAQLTTAIQTTVKAAKGDAYIITVTAKEVPVTVSVPVSVPQDPSATTSTPFMEEEPVTGAATGAESHTHLISSAALVLLALVHSMCEN